MSEIKRLIGEVHRRSLWQVLGIYLAGSWLALQVVEQLAEAAGLPTWIRGLALVLVIMGLPMVLATAFVQEGAPTPPGDQPDPAGGADTSGAAPPVPDGLASGSSANRFFTWRNALAGGVIAFAALGVTAVGWVIFGPGPGTLIGGDMASEGPPSVAVLPFENLNVDGENQVFTDGIHQDVISQLTTVDGLTVISRQSVLEYRDRTADLGTIGSELSVGTVVAATVQRSEDRVRVSASLIDVSTQEQLWAQQYDETLTDVFQIQSDIAGEIVAALASNLAGPSEAARPTDVFAAYEDYLTGSLSLSRIEERQDLAALVTAREHLTRAVEADPSFAEAHAALAATYDWISRLDQGDVRFASGFGGTGRAVSVEDSQPAAIRGLARESVDRALALDPNLAAAHLVLARIEENEGNDGMAHIDRALELEPGNASAMMQRAVALRARGRWDEALETGRRAIALNPRASNFHRELGITALYMKRHDEAEDALETALLLAENDPIGLPWIMQQRHALELAVGGGSEGVKDLFRQELDRGMGDDWFRSRFVSTPEVLVGGDYDATIESFHPEATDLVLRCTCYYHKGMRYRVAGDMERARVYFDSLVQERGTEPPPFANRSMEIDWLTRHARDLARAGRTAESRELLDRTREMIGDSTGVDQYVLATIGRQRASAYAELGDVDRAIEQMEIMLATPSWATPYSLRDRMLWLPLRGNPKWDAFVEEKLAEVEASHPQTDGAGAPN